VEVVLLRHGVGAKVVDVGCATGNTLAVLHTAGFCCIHGVDNSMPMLKLTASHPVLLEYGEGAKSGGAKAEGAADDGLVLFCQSSFPVPGTCKPLELAVVMGTSPGRESLAMASSKSSGGPSSNSSDSGVGGVDDRSNGGSASSDGNIEMHTSDRMYDAVIANW
jgi:hypothetical protein